MSFFADSPVQTNKEKSVEKNHIFHDKRFLPLNQRESNNNTDTTASFLS